MPAEQSAKSHARWDPAFHFFAGPVLILNVIAVSIWYWHHRAAHAHSGPWAIVVSIALVVIAIKSRSNALKVQDRVIRLEERMRLASLTTPAEMAELDSLTTRQYIGLRFASNAELPALARRAVRENLTEKQIKESIVAWRPDKDRV